MTTAMRTKTTGEYTPITALDVANIIGLCDGCDSDEEISGEELAEALLSGEEPFEPQEIAIIAAHVGLSADELAHRDKRFAVHMNDGTQARVEIARRLVANNMSVEYAAEMCRIDVCTIKQ